MRGKILLILLLLSFLVVLAVGATTEITFWFAGGDPKIDLPVVKKQLDDFTAETGIKVNFVVIPWAEDPHTKIQLAIMSGKAPDLVKLGSPFEHVLARFGALEPLDKYIPDSLKKALSPGLLDSSIYKSTTPANMTGKIISIPYFTDVRVVLYRKDIFKERGLLTPRDWTWDQFVTYAKRLTFDRNKDGVIDVYGFGTSANYASQFIIWCWQAGAEVLDEDGRPCFTTPQFLEGLRFYEDLYKTHKVVQPGAITANLQNIQSMLAAGQVAMYIDAGDAALALQEKLGDKLGAALLPKHPKTGKRTAFAGADSFVIPAMSRHKDEAAKLLVYLMDKNRMMEYCKVSGFLPSRTDLSKDPYFSKNPIKSIFLKQVADSKAWIGHPEASFISRKLRETYQEVLSGKIDLVQGMERAQKEIEDYLKQKGYLK